MCDISKSIETAFAIANAGEGPQAKGKESLRVCLATELEEGGVRIIEHGSSSIGVFRKRGAFFAVRNVCPHQGAPLCLGELSTTYAPSEVHNYKPALEGHVLRCPWHGWEFDITTGKGLYDARSRIKTYATRVDAEGILWIDL